MEQTGFQVVFVRDDKDNIVHTHEVIYFAGAGELTGDQLRFEAIDSAKKANPRAGELVASIASRQERDDYRSAAQQHLRSAREPT